MLAKLQKWLAENPHAIALPILLGLYLLCFFALDFWEREPRFILHSPLDDLIPFNEWFAGFYFIWFAAFPLALAVFLLLDKADFQELCFVIFAGAGVCFLAYILLPTGLELRPETVPRDNLAARLMQFIWLIDAPRNVCPSLHCSISAAIALQTWRSRKLRGRWLWQTAVTVLMLLICLATLFVKQHSVWDVAAGWALSLLLFTAAEAWRRRRGI